MQKKIYEMEEKGENNNKSPKNYQLFEGRFFFLNFFGVSVRYYLSLNWEENYFDWQCDQTLPDKRSLSTS